MSTQFDHITIDPKRMNGQPCIRGMRLTVRRVVEAVALYRIVLSSSGNILNWRTTTSAKRWSSQPVASTIRS